MTSMYLGEGPSSPGIRIPAIAYEKTNGFPYTGYPGPLIHDINAMEVDQTLEPTRAALDAHRTAEYILTQKDRPIPTLEQMQEELKPETVSTIKERISDLQNQHLSDLQRLYAWHAAEYLDDAWDRYYSKDETQYLAEAENNPTLKQSYARLDMLYEESRRNVVQMIQWQNDIEHMRHSHILLLNQAREDLRMLEKQEEEERKRLESAFPTSIEDFYSKSKDVQARVVRFLTMHNESGKEKMLNEFGWASRQVKPLQDLFVKDDKFKSEIILQSMFPVTDPRKAPRPPAPTKPAFPLPLE